MHRREAGLPEGTQDAAGFAIARNPGVVCLWRTTDFRPFLAHAGNAGTLVTVGEPLETLWYCEGRLATRDEVEESLAAGLPILEQMAEHDGAEGKEALLAAVARAQRYMPSPAKVAV
jgi:hypothetical protein